MKNLELFQLPQLLQLLQLLPVKENLRRMLSFKTDPGLRRVLARVRAITCIDVAGKDPT